jgi:hypothetical protein
MMAMKLFGLTDDDNHETALFAYYAVKSREDFLNRIEALRLFAIIPKVRPEIINRAARLAEKKLKEENTSIIP